MQIINACTSKDPLIMCLVRLLVLKCMFFNLYIKSEHISGINNCIADNLSRQQVKKAKALLPTLEENPTAIPPELRLPMLLRD